MRLVPLLALCLAAPLAAQTSDPTPPERYYPLGIGDIREHVGRGLGIPWYPPYVQRESVVGDTTVGTQRYRVVERLRTENGGPVVRTRHAVRFDTVVGRPVERLPSGDERPLSICRLDDSTECPLSSWAPDASVWIGSEVVVTSVRTVSHFAAGETYAAGIGFVERMHETSEYIEEIAFARIGGVTYGNASPSLPPLAPEPEAYWPLSVGNTWVERYDIVVPRYEWQTVRAAVVVSDTTYHSVERCTRYDGTEATCATALVRVDNRTGEIYERVGDEETTRMCGLLPTAESGALRCDLMGLPTWELTAEVPATVEIGGQSVSTASMRRVSVPDFSMSYAAGIGPLPTAGLTGVGRLVYARIGGVEYGVNPVADEVRPSAPALALRASPTPTDGAVTLAVGGATSPAAVEVFDALGRQVWRGTVVGETALDTRAWAPGVYVVRATADGATATTRLVRR